MVNLSPPPKANKELKKKVLTARNKNNKIESKTSK